MKAANAVPGAAARSASSPSWARLLAFVYQNKGSFLNASKTQGDVSTAGDRRERSTSTSA